ncbi:glycosyltransferase family 2 protein [Psychroserpens sp. Hel_I_66]|uniref:glycosyltransferase family 2 protein n=1 Tax=Psychroserpens sp. Hel_I_66 TaxID=1250004 RepID=UPI00064725B1|nr:glycosyltransferase family 2 protein [Psychroserpens sp. Hel_I_66]
MSIKKVSIVIPSYNAIAYIPDTLNSVFQQSYSNIEVIVIDDGSTDGTLDYLKTITHPNFSFKKNRGKGACAARNYGFELSLGKYIQFLDADDLLSPDKIENQVQDLEQNPEYIAVCSTVHFYEKPEHGEIKDSHFLYNTNNPKQFLLKLFGGDGLNHGMVGQHAYLSPRFFIEKAGGWNEKLFKDQDGEFFTRVIKASKGICHTPDVFAYYRKHVRGNNIANQKERKHVESQFKALISKSKQLKELEDSEAYRNAFALQSKLLAVDAYPHFMDVYDRAINLSNRYGGSTYEPILGGKIIEMVKSIFGWKNAKTFKLFLHRIKDLIMPKA